MIRITRIIANGKKKHCPLPEPNNAKTLAN